MGVGEFHRVHDDVLLLTVTALDNAQHDSKETLKGQNEQQWQQYEHGLNKEVPGPASLFAGYAWRPLPVSCGCRGTAGLKFNCKPSLHDANATN